MKKGYIVILLIAIVLFGIGYYNYQKPGKYDTLAKCISEKGVKFYGSFQCSHCADQKRIIGKSMEYINYIECGPLSGPLTKICQEEGIRSYPKWEFNGEKISKVLTIEELSSMSGCKNE